MWTTPFLDSRGSRQSLQSLVSSFNSTTAPPWRDQGNNTVHTLYWESSSGSPELTIFTDQLQTARQRGQGTMGKMAGLITKARLPRPQAHRQPHVRLLDRSWTARHLQLTLRSRSHSLDRPTLADDIQLLLVGVDVPFM